MGGKPHYWLEATACGVVGAADFRRTKRFNGTLCVCAVFVVSFFWILEPVFDDRLASLVFVIGSLSKFFCRFLALVIKLYSVFVGFWSSQVVNL